MKFIFIGLESFSNISKDVWKIGGAILGCVSANYKTDKSFLKDNRFAIIEMLDKDPWRAIIGSMDYLKQSEIEHFRSLHKYDPDKKGIPYYFVVRNKSNVYYVIYSDDRTWYPINTKSEQNEAVRVGLVKGLVKEQLDFSSSSDNVFVPEQNQDSSNKNIQIFWLPTSTRPKSFPELTGQMAKARFWHVGIVYDKKYYECFNHARYKISSMERKLEIKPQQPVYVSATGNVDILHKEIKSGTDCATYVARVLGLSTSTGSTKDPNWWPDTIYNHLLKKV